MTAPAYQLDPGDRIGPGRVRVPWPGLHVGPILVELNGEPRRARVDVALPAFAIATLEPRP